MLPRECVSGRVRVIGVAPKRRQQDKKSDAPAAEGDDAKSTAGDTASEAGDAAADSKDTAAAAAEVLTFSGVDLKNRKVRLLKGDKIEFHIMTT
jgi:hypothetical protein